MGFCQTTPFDVIVNQFIERFFVLLNDFWMVEVVYDFFQPITLNICDSRLFIALHDDFGEFLQSFRFLLVPSYIGRFKSMITHADNTAIQKTITI